MELKKMKIIKVERNNFKDKDDKDVKYCKVYFLDPVAESENAIGFETRAYPTNYDNYDIMVDYFNSNKVHDVEFEIVEYKDNLKRRMKKIDGIELN